MRPTLRHFCRGAALVLVATPLAAFASSPDPAGAASSVAAPLSGADPLAPLADLPPPPATQRILLEASTEPRAWSPDLAVRLHGSDVADLEAPVRVPLVRDEARQGFYAAEAMGPARRFLDVELVLTQGGVDTTLWRRVVPLEDPDAVTLSFLVERDADGARASRVAWLPWVSGGNTVGNTVTLAVAFGWGALCLAYVGWLARGRASR